MKVLNGQGAIIDITLAASKRVFGIFAALTESKRELIAERTTAGLASARVRGRKSGRPYKVTLTKLRLVMPLMGSQRPDSMHGVWNLGSPERPGTGI